MWISNNWIKLKSLWQDASNRRLALALGLSFLIHLYLIGNFNFNIPNLNAKRYLIEARLDLPKILPVSTIKIPVEKKLGTKQVDLKKPIKSKKAKSHEPRDVPSSELILPDESLPTEPALADTITTIVQPEPVPTIDENKIGKSGLVTKLKPYQYIQSNFDVYTDKDEVPNRSATGTAKIIYERLPNGEQYQLTSLIQAQGLTSLIIPDLLQKSEGFLDGIGLQPAHYLYQFGNKNEEIFSADFNWRTNKLNLHSEKGDQSFDLQDGTQDLLSFMYQFMFVPPLKNMQVNITNGKKLAIYDYTLEGEETLATKLGDIKTIHIVRMAPEGEKKTELWLALDYQHVPVKIRETSDDGNIRELLISSLDARLEPLPPE